MAEALATRIDVADACGARFHKTAVGREDRADGSIVLRFNEPLGTYPERFHDWLFAWTERTPDRIFMAERIPGKDGWATITYREAAEKALRIAAALAERELSAERPIVVLSGNSIDHQLLGLGGMLVGIPHAPISVAYSLISQDHGKLRHILQLLDPGLVYASNAEVFAKALALPEMAGREIVTNRPAAAIPGTTPFDDLLKGGSATRLAEARGKVGAETIAKFLFTSGSTGVPKAVTTTHRMLCSNAQMSNQIWTFMDQRPPVFVDWLPWSHVFGGNHNMGQVLRGGGTLYIDDGRPLAADVGRTIRNLEEISTTTYFNVPRGYDFLLPELRKNDALRKRFFADIDAIFYAGASLPAHLWDGLGALADSLGRTPASMLTGWGLTETSPTATLLHRHGGESGNIGIPLPGVELKLAPHGEKMEARVRGPNVMPGYWRMPEATAKAFDEEGFFRTGDALLFVDKADPHRGVFFNGRVAEDFKLTSGTWVHTGGMRARALAALGALASDVVVTGPDRLDVGLFVFPSPSAVRDETYVPRLLEAIRAMNAGRAGSSEIVRRAMVMIEPPSLDKGEMTDKGSLNMHAILDCRRVLLDRLYGDDNDPDVLRP